MKTSTIKDVEVIDFSKHKEKSGTLVAIEELKNIPFELARVFYILNVPNNEVRGKHAHKKQEQVLICVNGSCEVSVKDSHNLKRIVLDKSSQGLYIPSGIWNEITYHTNDTILLVLTNECYDVSDYISDWSRFIELKGNAV